MWDKSVTDPTCSNTMRYVDQIQKKLCLLLDSALDPVILPVERRKQKTRRGQKTGQNGQKKRKENHGNVEQGWIGTSCALYVVAG